MSHTMNSPTAIHELETRRQQLADELLDIRSLVRGALTEQFLKVPRKGQEEPVVRGPYFVLSRSQNGKTKSQRVKMTDVEQVKQDVANHQRFKALCEEFAALTEQLGEIEHAAAAGDDVVKKKPKSRSRKARKSSRS